MRVSWPRVAALALMVVPSCSTTAGSAPATPPPSDQVVFSVTASAGFAPAVFRALVSPALLIYGDGRMLTKVSTLAIQAVPARYEMARLDPATVAGFLSSARTTVNPATDFGTPGVTDVGGTTVTLDDGHGLQKVNVYAFDETFETGLTTSQRNARASLRSTIERANSLTAQTNRAPYSPDRVMVYELDPNSARTPATVGWPGPPPAAFLIPSTQWVACGELRADPAEEVYRAALQNPGAGWLIDGVTRILAVNPLPVTDACP